MLDRKTHQIIRQRVPVNMSTIETSCHISSDL